ncbi:DNA polymerase III subunit beta [Microbispora cellulosiformans]|uniref:Beta sliding clamp n=1 Tax=Microbispora cellulosiformans TaxID=2614688 RepID=A0A5J5K909_9ACTN|nr:DNA polymerase III subunit beta [Microbispora cellulosiformans]
MPKRPAPVKASFRVDRDELANAVGWTAKSLPPMPSVPVLGGMHLTLWSGALTVAAYDYEVSSQATIPVDGDGPATVLVPGKLLAEITKALPDHPVDVTVDGPRVTLECGPATFQLTTMPVEDYPALPVSPPQAGQLDAAAFAEAAAQAVVAAGKDDTLPMLTGVHATIDGERVTLAATDRYRLAVRELTWQPPSPGFRATFMIPARTLGAAAKTFGSAGLVELAAPADGDEQADLLALSGGDRRVTTRLLDPEFPNYRDLIPSEFSGFADVDVAPLTEAVKRVTLVADRKTPVRLTLSGGQVTVEAGARDDALGTEKLPAAWDGPDFEIRFNAAYLLDGLGAMGAARARLNLTTPKQPAVLVPLGEDGEPDTAYLYLIMPVAVA